MQTVVTIQASEVRELFDRLTEHGKIASAIVRRRTDVYLRYTPVDDKAKGKLAYLGDACDLVTRQYTKGSKVKIMLQPAGAERLVQFRKKGPRDPETGLHTPLKHWEDKGSKRGLAFYPREKQLFGPVIGMYNDSVKRQPDGSMRIGRWGEWRSWMFVGIADGEVTEIRGGGQVFQVEA